VPPPSETTDSYSYILWSYDVMDGSEGGPCYVEKSCVVVLQEERFLPISANLSKKMYGPFSSEILLKKYGLTI
jgi:hypothetical protein